MRPVRRRTALLTALAVAATTAVGVLSIASTGTSVSVAKAPGSPIGYLDTFARVPGGVKVTGWTIDPSSARRSIQVVTSISGKTASTVVANLARNDVARRYPSAGALHGFSVVVPVREGVRTVCVTARNIGSGSNWVMGCKNRATWDYGPIGRAELWDTRPGHLHVRGFFIDRDAITKPVVARVTVDGVATDLLANRNRTIANEIVPGAGNAHGYEAYFPATQGAHRVCVTARNIGYGSDNSYGCRTITLNDNPVAGLAVAQQSGKLRVSGWAFDRDNLNAASTVTIKVDGVSKNYAASGTRTDIAKKYGVPANRGFDVRLAAAEGTHQVCAAVRNIGFGSDYYFGCRNINLNYTPTAVLSGIRPTVTGMTITGYASDPDTTNPVQVRVSVNNRLVGTVVANGKGATNNGRNFALPVPTTSGPKTVCVVAVNQVSGTNNSPPACQSTTLALSPAGALSSIGRSGNNIRITGWSYDPDGPVSIDVTVDGRAVGSYPATSPRPDVAKLYPTAGPNRGFDQVLTTNADKHTVCVTMRNAGGGADRSLGCKLLYAVNPKPASAPRNVAIRATYGAITVSWAAPASDGGAPPSSYTVVVTPGGKTVTVPATTTSVTVGGLAAKKVYRGTVTANNIAGKSPGAPSALVRIPVGPAPQTTTPPVSTSRYMRNIRTCNTAEFNEMKSFGRADALANPANHRYLQLLDIGGQSQANGGVVLSATTRFVTYSALLLCSRAYVDGYAGGMRSNAPAMIAIGVNNDMDVNTTTGRDWATKIVNPLVSYSRRYAGITIAGANDIEPGFSGNYAATRNWLSGYLAATSAKFVFNGSADGCAWTVASRSCNNGWTMAGLYNLAGGAAPSRIINLPQVYNYTMADQWKYISLTGVAMRQPRINFGGPLTEVTACAQARSCDSIGGRSAWQRMWSNLQSHPSLRVGTLPYATDLRIDS